MSPSAVTRLSVFLTFACASALGQQVNLNFQSECPNGPQVSGPCSPTLEAAGPGMPVTIQTSDGPVTFSGGIVASGPDAYATASFGGSGYSQAITITLPTTATNFYLTMLNGDPYPDAFTVSDNAGHVSSFTIPANSESGVQGVSFQSVGTVVTVTTSDPQWDFGIESISFTALPGTPSLSVGPNLLNFPTQANSSTALQQTIQVQNTAGGILSFTASLASASPWVSISPSSGTATLGSPVAVTVTVNPAALTTGAYRNVVQITSSAGNAMVPVSVFAANVGPILSVSPVGVLFNVVQGAGSSATQNILVADNGSPNTMSEWSVAPASGAGVPNSDFLTFGSTTGQAEPGNPSTLTLSLNDVATGLPLGVYYELVTISDNTSQNSPQFVTAILNIATTAPPQITPAGLLFVGQVGRNIPSQQFTVNWSATGAQVFQATPVTPSGQNWLVPDTGGSASAHAPATLNVSVNTAGLGAGIYSGSIILNATATGLPLGAVNVTLILGSGIGTAAVAEDSAGLPAAVHRQTTIANCTGTAVVLTETGIPNNFSVPAGWPANLVTTMTDNCGNLLDSGSVAANFSNGDPPLALVGQGSGQYVATWQPSNLANTTITLSGNSGTLTPASELLAGVVTANQAPVLNPNGIVDDFSFLAGGALAPGTWSAAFGSQLATSATGTELSAPFPTSYQSTQLIVASFVTPLYYVSGAQLDAEIPAELRPNQQYASVGVVNGQLTLPVSVTVVPVAPGVDTYSDGVTAVAQHQDYSLVNSSKPAHPGDIIFIYLVGMGATNPAVASNQVAPGATAGSTAATVTVQPMVMLGNQNAPVLFAGLTPGSIGLYQIDFMVPSNVTAGNLSLTVSQGTVSANPTILPVAVP
jgi:uncharacterized protein (TIGR03437 family)